MGRSLSQPDETPEQYRARRNLAAKAWRANNLEIARAYRALHKDERPEVNQAQRECRRMHRVIPPRPAPSMPRVKWLDNYSIA